MNQINDCQICIYPKLTKDIENLLEIKNKLFLACQAALACWDSPYKENKKAAKEIIQEALNFARRKETQP